MVRLSFELRESLHELSYWNTSVVLVVTYNAMQIKQSYINILYTLRYTYNCIYIQYFLHMHKCIARLRYHVYWTLKKDCLYPDIKGLIYPIVIIDKYYLTCCICYI